MVFLIHLISIIDRMILNPLHLLFTHSCSILTSSLCPIFDWSPWLFSKPSCNLTTASSYGAPPWPSQARLSATPSLLSYGSSQSTLGPSWTASLSSLSCCCCYCYYCISMLAYFVAALRERICCSRDYGVSPGAEDEGLGALACMGCWTGGFWIAAD